MPDGGYAWVVLASTTVSLAFFGLFVYSSGLFHVAMRERFHDDHFNTAWAGALFVCNFALTGPIASTVINRFSCRISMMLSGLLYAVGFLLTAFATSVNQCIVTLGVVSGLAGGLHIGAAWTVLGYRFRQKLNLACGVVGLGIGVGTFALAPIMQGSLTQFGFTGFFILLAGVGLQNVVLGSFCRPSKIERESKKVHRTTYKTRSKKDTVYNRLCCFCSCNCLIYKNKALVLFSFSQFLHGFGLTVVYYFLPSFCNSVGNVPMQTAWVLSAAGFGSFVGRGLLGLAATSGDFDEMIIYFSCIGIFGMTTAAFPLFVKYHSGQLVYAVVLGVYTGCINSILVSLIINMAGVMQQASALGSVNFLYGVGSLLGTVSAAYITDHVQSFSGAFVTAGASNILSALFAMAIPSVSKTQGQDGYTRKDRTVNEEEIFIPYPEENQNKIHVSKFRSTLTNPPSRKEQEASAENVDKKIRKNPCQDEVKPCIDGNSI